MEVFVPTVRIAKIGILFIFCSSSPTLFCVGRCPCWDKNDRPASGLQHM